MSQPTTVISPPPVPTATSTTSSTPSTLSIISALLPTHNFSGTHSLHHDPISTTNTATTVVGSSAVSIQEGVPTSPYSTGTTPPLGQTDYSERLSRKVLASLKSLNESLGEVRRSVAKIDSIAHHRLVSSTGTPSSLNNLVSPLVSSPSSSLFSLTQNPNLGSPTFVTTATTNTDQANATSSPVVPAVRSLSMTFDSATSGPPTSSSETSTTKAVPAPPPVSMIPPPLPIPSFSSPSKDTLVSSTPKVVNPVSTTGMTPVSMHEAATLLRKVLLSPAFKGSGIDDNTLADLASVLSQDDMDHIRAHVAFRPSFILPLSSTADSYDNQQQLSSKDTITSPSKSDSTRVRTPGSTHSGHSSRPHTPPPANWHTPGSGPRHSSHERSTASLSRHNSVRSHGSVHFGGEEEIPASDLDAAAAEMNAVLIAEAQHNHEQEQKEVSMVPASIDSQKTVIDGDFDEDEDDDEQSTNKGNSITPSTGENITASPRNDVDDEDSEDGLLRHPSQRRPGGLVTGSRKTTSKDGTSYDEVNNDDSSSDTDTDDFTESLHASTHNNIDGHVIPHHTSSNLALNTMNDKSLVMETVVPSLTKVSSGTSVTESPNKPRMVVSLPSDTPVPIFRFTQYMDPLPAELEDDSTDTEVPFGVDHITESDFYSSEAEVSELRRAKEQMNKSLLVPSSNTNNDDNATSSSSIVNNAATIKVGSSILAPGKLLPDSHTIVDTEHPPTVEDWNGGDANWPSVVVDERGTNNAPSRSRSSRASKRYEAFALRIVYEAGRTGFEESKEFQASIGEVIAGRFQVIDYLGSAAFSSALSCIDLTCGEAVCLKVIKNSKDFVDQSLDEIKLLRYINAQGDADAHNVLRLRDYFYHKEHLFLVTELLKDNLYEFQKYLMDNSFENYYTVPRIQRIARQVLEGLAFIHSKGLIHCDLKPENILIKSYSKCDIKVIDFGSSCFITDTLSTYIQSRSYRAPEIILGLPYTGVIDVWSLGCILCEMYNGKVLFANDTVQTILVRMQSLLGPFPDWMLEKGKDVTKYFSGRRDGTIFQLSEEHEGYLSMFSPSRSSLRVRLQCNDDGFLDFLASLLVLDPNNRPTAAKALQHPWLQNALPFEPYQMPG